MNNPVLLIDTWESGGEIDETILLANNIAGMIIRLNDISGGHHMDENFLVQWSQAKPLSIRIPYFVYNPWKNGQENYDWLINHLPDECGAVMVDVEVIYTGYSPSIYAAEFAKFYALVKARYNLMIYTGEWFLSHLAYWPKDALYWWAAYPFAFYNYETTTWDALRARLVDYLMPANVTKVPGILKMWQFTGDRIILPGCNKRMDVNVYYGTVDELKAWTNEGEVPPLSGDLILSEHAYYDGAIEQQIQTDTPHGKTIYNLTTIETAKVEKFFVSPKRFDRDYVPESLEKHNLHFAVNLDGWTTDPLTPTGYNASEGQPYGPVNVTETIWISKENIFSITRPSILWNAASVQNRLVREGIIPYIDKSLADIRARTAIGWTKDQDKVFLLTVDGGDHWSNDGLNFHDTAAILHKLGCWYAFMYDGGASTAKAVNDNGVVKIIGKTCGADSAATINGYPYDKPLERVVNVFGVKMKSGSVVIPPEGDDMEGLVEWVTTDTPKPRKTADMYDANTLPPMPINTKFLQMGEFTHTVLDPAKPLNMGVHFVQDAKTKYWMPEKYQQKTWIKPTGEIVIPPDSTPAGKKFDVHYEPATDTEPAKFIVKVDDEIKYQE